MEPFSFHNLVQQLATGVINGSDYALVALAFSLVIFVTGRFHIAIAVTYTFTAYIAATASTSWGLPFGVSVVVGLLAGALLGVAMERVVYAPLAARAGPSALFIVLVASLGMSIIGEAAVGLIWLHSASVSIEGFTVSGITIGGVAITNLDVILVVTAWLVIGILGLVMARSALGRMIRAVRVNLDMSLVVGIDPARVFLIVFAIASAVSGLAAIYVTLQGAATPDMGEVPILYAITVAFLAGEAAGPARIGIVAVGVGVVESLSVFVVSASWSQVVIFGLLLVYVVARPLVARVRVTRAGVRSTASGTS